MKLVAYDFEALLRVAQQAPWTDGLKEVRQWARDVREKGDPRGSFRTSTRSFPSGSGFALPSAPSDGVFRSGSGFDSAALDATLARLGSLHEALGGARPLRDLIKDDPAAEIVPGCDGWRAYEDLVRIWTAIESEQWASLDLADEGGLLDELGKTQRADLRLGRNRALTRAIGKPYPDAWHALPRARIHHVSTDALEALASISRADVEVAARASSQEPAQVAAKVGELLRHFELARQLDTVVAVAS